MIPDELRQFETYVLAYSGGHDSTAALYWCLDNLPVERLRVVHNPTGAAWPMLPAYLDEVSQTTGIPIVQARAGDRPLPPARKPRQPFAHATNLFDMIRARGKWPSFWQRYCTKYLKAWPLRLYAAECDNPVLILGERAEESPARARRPVLGPDTFTGAKRYQYPNYRPVLHWPADAVAAYLTAHRAPVNPVYRYAPRCNCWCCPLEARNRRQIATVARLFPELARQAVAVEVATGHTWRHRISLADIVSQAIQQPTMPGLEAAL